MDKPSSTPDLQDMTAEASLSLADSYFVDENMEEAIDAYAAAISLSRDTDVTLRFRSLSHRSAAFYTMGRYKEALEDANQALLSTGPSGLRSGEGEMCHKRSGVAAFQLQEYLKAKEAFQQAGQLASLNQRSDASYKEWIRQCEEKLEPPPAERKQPASKKSPPAAATTENKSAPPKEATASVSSPATAPEPPAKVANTTNNRPTMPKYQYYQSDKVMTISVLEATVKEEDLKVDFQPKWLTVTLRKGGVDFTVIAGALYGDIDVDKSKVVIKEEKVLIKLRKIDVGEWHELFGKAQDSKPPPKPKNSTEKTSDATTTRARPYASHRDWDSIEKSLVEEEKNEKPEGDEAMNKLFKQIYAGASDETKRAMIKSYQTSGGTVLSTNWDEVSKKDYEKERTAPKGMEWKDWEGKKLPISEDD